MTRRNGRAAEVLAAAKRFGRRRNGRQISEAPGGRFEWRVTTPAVGSALVHGGRHKSRRPNATSSGNGTQMVELLCSENRPDCFSPSPQRVFLSFNSCPPQRDLVCSQIRTRSRQVCGGLTGAVAPHRILFQLFFEIAILYIYALID